MPGVKEKSSGMGDRVRSTVSGASEKYLVLVLVKEYLE